MNKRGISLERNLIILLVLGIIVLIIAVIFIRTQFTKGGQKYEQFTEQLDKCEGFMSFRYCDDQCPTGMEVKPLGKGWADCGKEEGLKDKPKCCVK